MACGSREIPRRSTCSLQDTSNANCRQGLLRSSSVLSRPRRPITTGSRGSNQSSTKRQANRRRICRHGSERLWRWTSMADFVFNQGKGAVAEKIRDGANLIMVPYDVGASTDATIRDDDNLTAVLTHVTERTTGGWNRKTITNGSVTLTVDDTNDRV